jgi:ubiquinone/menaquinone biosynthesis C-methylase UbiE
VGLDPAYTREMRRLIDRAVIEGDRVLDLEAGTGLGTLHAARKAKQVVAIDLSADMIARLKKKARREGLTNIECLAGSFPRDHGGERTYSVVFSSFAIVHWPREARGELYRKIFSVLEPAGRLALFSAQGEVASCFETRAEVEGNLEAAGFVDLEVMDVADIYRAITARRPF